MKKFRKAFTLVELLIVVIIIGILATLIVVSYNGARAKARDSVRKTDLRNIETAMNRYYLEFNTYFVKNKAGTYSGWRGSGEGCFGFDIAGSTDWPLAPSRALYDQGFLSVPLIKDPLKPADCRRDYLLYTCTGTTQFDPIHFSISATLENGTAAELTTTEHSCNGSKSYANGGDPCYNTTTGVDNCIDTGYGKNYAKGNKTW